MLTTEVESPSRPGRPAQSGMVRSPSETRIATTAALPVGFSTRLSSSRTRTCSMATPSTKIAAVPQTTGSPSGRTRPERADDARGSTATARRHDCRGGEADQVQIPDELCCAEAMATAWTCKRGARLAGGRVRAGGRPPYRRTAIPPGSSNTATGIDLRFL